MKQDNNKIENIEIGLLKIVALFSLMLNVALLVYIYPWPIYNQIETNETSSILQEEEISPTLLQCQDEEGIKARMGCVNDYVKSVFIYKVRPDSEFITRKQLIEEGGDCANWADFYIEVGKELGFQAEGFRFCLPEKTIDNRTSIDCHKVAFVYDETGYCKLDQRNKDCFVYTIGDKYD